MLPNRFPSQDTCQSHAVTFEWSGDNFFQIRRKDNIPSQGKRQKFDGLQRTRVQHPNFGRTARSVIKRRIFLRAARACQRYAVRRKLQRSYSARVNAPFGQFFYIDLRRLNWRVPRGCNWRFRTWLWRRAAAEGSRCNNERNQRQTARTSFLKFHKKVPPRISLSIAQNERSKPNKRGWNLGEALGQYFD